MFKSSFNPDASMGPATCGDLVLQGENGGQRGRPSRLSRPGLLSGGAHLEIRGVLLRAEGSQCTPGTLGAGGVVEGTICTPNLND